MLKIRFKERLFIIFFALFLALYSPVVKYQEVQAMEWVGMEVSYTTALKFILGLLGVTVAHEVTDDWWEQTWSDCFDYTMQDQAQTTEQINEWWNKLKKGTLDTASSVWTSVKEWINDKLQSSSGNDGSLDNKTVKDIIEMTGHDLSYYGLSSSNLAYYIVSPICVTYMPNVTNSPLTIYVSDGDVVFTEKDGILRATFSATVQRIMLNHSTSPVTDNLPANRSPIIAQVANIIYPLYIYGYLSGFDTVTVTPWSDLVGDSTDSDFTGINENVNNLDVINDDATDFPTDTESETAIPMPWDNVGATDTDAQDTIDALQEKVATGELTLEEYCEKVQELLEVIVFDTTTDAVFPTTTNPDTGEDEKVDEKLEENRDNMTFTIGGLEKVFPFCIPWDIYSFVTLLVAEPVAPVINYPFYNPVTNEDIIITIDFSAWENVVVVFRYIFDFLLIIGLLLLARSLSGAGGDD